MEIGMTGKITAATVAAILFASAVGLEWMEWRTVFEEVAPY
jgi:hypothetical protein